MRLWIIILLMAFIFPAYGEVKKAARVTIKAMIVETPADNLKEKLSTFKGMNDFFKDPGKVKKIVDIPPITTLAGTEGNIQITKPLYYIANAKVDKNGDILCKLKNEKTGIIFKALPIISKENPKVITVDYQLEVKIFIRRVNPKMPALVDIQELEPLWWPIINSKSMKSNVILKNGETVIIGGFTKSKPMDVIASKKTKDKATAESAKVKNKNGDILELTLLTARW